MSLTRITSAIAAGVIGAVTLVAAPPASAAPLGNRSLVTVLGADGDRLDRNWQDFDIVEKAVGRVLAANPDSAVAVLADGRTRLTAFVPTDRAFRGLITDLTGKRPATERGVLRSLNATVDAATLESVLLYHVVPGARITYRQAEKADGARLQTALSDAAVRVNVTKRHNVFLLDADRDDLNPRVLRAAKNLNKGDKQLAHGINRVLRPVDL